MKNTDMRIRIELAGALISVKPPVSNQPNAHLINYGIKIRWRITGEFEWNEVSVKGFTHTLHFLVSDCGKELQVKTAIVNIDGLEGPWSAVQTMIIE